MASYTTPPQITSNIKQGATDFLRVVKPKIPAIKAALVNKAFANTKVKSTYLSAATVSNIIDKLIIAPTHAAEGGWVDHPNDSGGPTMRGVILNTFRGTFDTIFINTGIQDVSSAAVKFKSLGWYTGNKGTAGWELGKQALFLICSDSDVASLWVHAFGSLSSNRYPSAVMATEPYLGYLMHQGAWASGGGYWTLYRYNTAFNSIGYNSSTSVASFVQTLVSFNEPGTLVKDDAYPLALKALVEHGNWILTQKNTKNGVFVEGWLNRLVFNPPISWTHNVVNFVDAFEKGLIATNEKEQKYLLAKAKLYKQTEIVFPNLQ